jgi:hypothetical protein
LLNKLIHRHVRLKLDVLHRLTEKIFTLHLSVSTLKPEVIKLQSENEKLSKVAEKSLALLLPV